MNEPTWGWAVLFVDTGEIAFRSERYQYPHTTRRGLKEYLRKLMGIVYNPDDDIRYWMFRGDFDTAGGTRMLAQQPKTEIVHSKL